MKLNEHQNKFLGGVEAIVVTNQEQFEKLKEFMSIKNLFQKDGNPIRIMNLNVNAPVAFYRDYNQSFIDYDTPSLVEKKYKLVEFNDVFVEQMNFFGSETMLHQPPEELIVNIKEEKQMDEQEKVVEAETHEVKDEISLVEVINTLVVESVVPAKIVENVTENKDKLIQAIKQYDNIVVTEDNYQDLTKTRADLNNKKKYLIDQRKKVKDEAAKNINEFVSTVGEVIKAFENVVDHLDGDIKKFDEMAKQKKKEDMMNTIIKPNLDKGIEAGFFTREIADQFVFDEAWLNKGAFTATGNLTKKTQESINAELNRLVSLYQQQKNDIATIESTVKQLSIAHKLDNELGADTYIELYKKGTSMPDVQARINQDIEMIKKTVEKAVEKTTQEIVSQDKNTVRNTQSIESEDSQNKNDKSYITDDKTGEVLGRFNGNQILVDLATAPKGYENKEFSYTYTFSGPCAVIMTLNKFLKALSKLFPEFKYERLGK